MPLPSNIGLENPWYLELMGIPARVLAAGRVEFYTLKRYRLFSCLFLIIFLLLTENQL